MNATQIIPDLPSTPDVLFTLEDLEVAYLWIFKIRKKYSAHSDIWCLRRNWEKIKFTMLNSLNEGAYQFGLLDRYEFNDAILSLWSSEDMIAFNHLSSLGITYEKRHFKILLSHQGSWRFKKGRNANPCSFTSLSICYAQ